MKNQPGPVGPQHQQVADAAYQEPQQFDPEPELFDPAEVAAEIWAATHPDE